MNREEFIEKVKKLNIDVDNNKLEKLDKYKVFLQSENKKYNLTAITLDNEIYLKHFYDSLVTSKYFDFNKVNSLTDVGTGAGLPGIVLKIFFPHLKLYLVDSNHKKIDFLNKVIDLLDLDNCYTVKARIENINIKTDVVIARAVGSISYIGEVVANIVGKYLILLRGKKEPISNNMLDELGYKINSINNFSLYNNSYERTIIILEKVRVHDKKYPRMHSTILKKPL